MRAGSDEATEAADLRRRLERSVARLCPRWLGQEREDLVQASMVRILERLREGDIADVNATYLWKTAYSVILDELRRARRRYEIPLDDDADQIAGGAEAGPEGRTLGREFVRAVHDCLAGIAADRRRAVQLRLAGLRYAETAALLASDEKRTANLVFRGFEDLRSCLRAKGIAG